MINSESFETGAENNCLISTNHSSYWLQWERATEKPQQVFVQEYLPKVKIRLRTGEDFGWERQSAEGAVSRQSPQALGFPAMALAHPRTRLAFQW